MRVDGVKIYALIKQQEKTQTYLASASGVARGTISQIINGKTCKRETAEKLASALGVTVSDIAAKGVDLSEITDKRK